MDHDRTAHWQTVYQDKRPDQVSWYRSHLDVSMALLVAAGLNADSRVIDIGAGASTLVDDLLEFGVRRITALDISAASLQAARERLGARGTRVEWRVADIVHVRFAPDSYEFWHDRAALHFLVEPADAAAYVAAASRALVGGGHTVIGCFAADGPDHCSHLPVARREPGDIAQLFAPAFSMVQSRRELHSTPWGAPQSFVYALLRKSTSR